MLLTVSLLIIFRSSSAKSSSESGGLTKSLCASTRAPLASCTWKLSISCLKRASVICAPAGETRPSARSASGSWKAMLRAMPPPSELPSRNTGSTDHPAAKLEQQLHLLAHRHGPGRRHRGKAIAREIEGEDRAEALRQRPQRAEEGIGRAAQAVHQHQRRPAPLPLRPVEVHLGAVQADDLAGDPAGDEGAADESVRRATAIPCAALVARISSARHSSGLSQGSGSTACPPLRISK